MTTAFAIPSGMWILIPGTEWEIYQDSANVAFLGDDDIPVRIRRAAKQPAIWGPRPPITSVGYSTGNPGSKDCRGLHCKCMNLDGGCPSPHHGDHDCPYERAST